MNSICGSFVTDFAFELGLSPELHVLDEAGAELALIRSLTSVVSGRSLGSDSSSYSAKIRSLKFDWQYEVRRLIEAARANGIDAERIGDSAERSIASLDECLGPVAGTAEGARCFPPQTAIDQALKTIRGRRRRPPRALPITASS